MRLRAMADQPVQDDAAGLTRRVEKAQTWFRILLAWVVVGIVGGVFVAWQGFAGPGLFSLSEAVLGMIVVVGMLTLVMLVVLGVMRSSWDVLKHREQQLSSSLADQVASLEERLAKEEATRARERAEEAEEARRLTASVAMLQARLGAVEETPVEEGPFEFQSGERIYVLHTRRVELNGGREQRIWFFCRKGKAPKSGYPSALPDGKEVGVNERTGLPFLRNAKKPGKGGVVMRSKSKPDKTVTA